MRLTLFALPLALLGLAGCVNTTTPDNTPKTTVVNPAPTVVTPAPTMVAPVAPAPGTTVITQP